MKELKRLLNKGCTVNCTDYDGRTPLHIAASNNNIEMVQKLLSVKDINVNPIDNFDMTPYHDAMIHKFTDIAELLKKNDGVIVHRDLGYKLCEAAFNKDIEKLKYLKGHGALVDTADYDLRTPLHLAACSNSLECVTWLLEQGANRNVKDYFGNKPIDDAKKYNHYQVFNKLNDTTGPTPEGYETLAGETFDIEQQA